MAIPNNWQLQKQTWAQVAATTVKIVPPPPENVNVYVDLQTTLVEDTFDPRRFRGNIVSAVRSDNSTRRTYCAGVWCYGVTGDLQPKLEDSTTFQYCPKRVFQCSECRKLIRRDKDRLGDLEMTKDLCQVVLEQRGTAKAKKTSFFIVSDDHFFNQVLAKEVADEGHHVYTGRVTGMSKISMFRD